MNIEYMVPLLDTCSEKAVRIAFIVDNSVEEIESYLEDFKLAHREYIMRI